MKFSIPSIVIVATAATAANALSTEAATLESRTFGYTFSPSNWYGTSASSKPWELNGGWGWYLGTGCSLPKWTAPVISKPSFCKFFWSQWLPSCQVPSAPKPPTTPGLPCKNGYAVKFQDYTTVAPDHSAFVGQTVGAATIDNENYLTFGLVDTIEECFKVCNDIPECAFVNFYEDRNSTPKNEIGGAGKKTCSAYKACSGTEKLTNFGSQTQSEAANLTKIVSSSGYCKSGSC